jgi:hypothetical protein
MGLCEMEICLPNLCDIVCTPLRKGGVHTQILSAIV